MTKRIGSSRRKTRDLLSVSKRDKGRISISKILQNFAIGDKVALNTAPNVHSGQIFRRFRDQIGIVKAMQGNCYKVSIKDGSKEKTLIVHPAHMRKI